MNNITLVGRLTKKPEIGTTASGKAVAKFQLAVTRPYNKKETDFINIETYGKNAENCMKYLDKGNLISLSGNLRVDMYKDKEGNNRSYTKVIGNMINFLYTGNKNNNGEVASGVEAFEPSNNGFEKIDENQVFQVIEDDDLPF